MFSLLKKEFNQFFGSLIGYLAILIFFILVGVLMWVLPGSFNLFDNEYSNLDTLFILAPWVFMFLIPAITMRFLADEKKIGTIELLVTKPLSDLQIIIAKFLAGLILILISLLPTLIFFISVYQMGAPKGNLDIGGTIGSYFGLIMLASVYLAIGIFASSITSNSIVSFILGMFLCCVFYIGFESFSSLDLFGRVDNIIDSLGISYHYKSISRGVVDTRDMIYFLSLISLFIMLTKTVLSSRKW